MKKKLWKLVVILIITVGILVVYMNKKQVGIKSELDKTQMVFRFAETKAKGHPSAEAANYFAQLVEKRSNGRIKIKVYYGDELGSDAEIIEQVQFGGIAMAGINILDLSETVSYLYEDFRLVITHNKEDILKWIDENSEEIEYNCERERITPLVWYYPDSRCFYSENNYITSLENLNQVKVATRTSKIMREIMLSLQSEAVNVKAVDIHNSFLKGYMDIGETTFAEFCLSTYYPIVKYMTLSEYISCPDIIIISTEVLTKLDIEDRNLILQCAMDTKNYQKDLMVAFKKNNLERVLKEKTVYMEEQSFNTSISECLKGLGE